MKKPDIPEFEAKRIQALQDLEILDTGQDDDFDAVTELAAAICDVPIALISLVDEKRQWFKSHFGIAAEETPRDISFCAHAINDPDNVLEITDASSDQRFHDNPLVTHKPDIKFYAGAPVRSPDNYPLGTVCVIDTKEKHLNKKQKQSLSHLGKLVEKLFLLRASNLELKRRSTQLEDANQSLDAFSYSISHDLRSPLSTITQIARLLKGKAKDAEEQKLTDLLEESCLKLLRLIEGVLEYARAPHLLKGSRQQVNLNNLIDEIWPTMETQKTTLKKDLQLTSIEQNQAALYQILQNLMDNAIKHNETDNLTVTLRSYQEDGHSVIEVKDNGKGISAGNQEKLFELFSSEEGPHYHKETTGIGLNTVKRLVRGLGGSITLSSEVDTGTTFYIKLPTRNT